MKALATWGGWDGHEPDKVAALLAGWLREAGAEVAVTDTLGCLGDPADVAFHDLIVPVWTISKTGREPALNVCAAVAGGTGIAGCHGGMCDAVRGNADWQFLTGSQWVAHSGNDGVRYAVRIVSGGPPVAHVKGYGRGRVCCNALGHEAKVIEHGPPAETLRRGLVWATRG